MRHAARCSSTSTTASSGRPADLVGEAVGRVAQLHPARQHRERAVLDALEHRGAGEETEGDDEEGDGAAGSPESRG
jgi:hypothetical protein